MLQTELNTRHSPAPGRVNATLDSEAVCHRFHGQIVQRRLGAHAHIFREGERRHHIYLVESGVVSSYKMLPDGRRQILGFTYPGELLGFEREDTYHCCAESLCVSRIRAIPLTSIDTLVQQEPGFGAYLLQQLSTELSDCREQLVALGRKSAMEKLATFLLHVSQRLGTYQEPADLVHLPMRRSDIADYLGLTIETVSRNITKLKLAHIIQLVSTTDLQIVDRESLVALSDGNQRM